MTEKKTFAHPDRKGINYKLYHRGDDMTCRWNISWNFEGKRKQRYGKINQGKSFSERYHYAEQLLQELYVEHRDHLPPCEIRAKAEAFIERMSHTWRPKTTSAHKHITREYFLLLDGRTPDEKFTRAFFNGLRKKYHAKTFGKKYQLLGRVLRECGYGWVLAGIERPKGHSKSYRPYQRNHRIQLMKWMQENDEELMLFCLFQYYCFIRPGELRKLRVGDILWDTMEIRMDGEITKNKKTENAVIPNVFIPTIEKRYLDASPEEYLFYTGEKTEPIAVNKMTRKHKMMLDGFGYGEGFALYSWKHTGAIMAIRAGIAVKELQLLMRHSSLQETDRYLQSLGIKDVPNFRRLMPDVTAATPRH